MSLFFFFLKKKKKYFCLSMVRLSGLSLVDPWNMQESVGHFSRGGLSATKSVFLLREPFLYCFGGANRHPQLFSHVLILWQAHRFEGRNEITMMEAYCLRIQFLLLVLVLGGWNCCTNCRSKPSNPSKRLSFCLPEGFAKEGFLPHRFQKHSAGESSLLTHALNIASREQQAPNKYRSKQLSE